MSIESNNFSHYPNGLQGRLRHVADHCQLPQLVKAAGTDPRVKAKHRSVRDFYPTYPQLNNQTEKDEYNVRLPKALGIMMCAGNYTNPYIEAVGGFDLKNLPGIASEIAQKGGKEAGAVFRVVFGASETMPLRALSYPLPALEMMKRMSEEGIEPPQLQILFANNVGVAVNKLDRGLVEKASRDIAGLSRKYIERFYPELSGSVVFMEDDRSMLPHVLETETGSLAHTVLERGSPDALAKLLQTGNGSAEKSHYYAAAHLIVHDTDAADNFRPIFYSGEVPLEASKIVSFGGKQEGLFYVLRHETKSHLNPNFQKALTFQYFTRHHASPYIPANNGDILISEAINGGVEEGVQRIGNTAKRDILYLKEVTKLRGGNLNEFLQEAQYTS